jgi:mono/diheme cytochrome c family protein
MYARIFFTCASVLVLGCSDPAPEPPVEIVDAPVGKEIYMMYCAQCHGIEGDGKSLIEIERPARSFLDGGFSFGNTVEAISKTTVSGIPGTPMPPFAEVLKQQQIHDVALYIRSLAPTIQDATPDETEMIVGERPVVVRGMIPPVQVELQLHPRGLLIGNPDGFSYEYRTDDVRLLAIRQGQFVSRTDWTGRGGTPLEPLGKIVVLVSGGNPNGMFAMEDGTPLLARLTSSSVFGEQGTISYDLVDQTGTVVAGVSETCKPTTGVRTLINQELVITAQLPITIVLPEGAQTADSLTVPSGTSTQTIIHAAVGGK